MAGPMVRRTSGANDQSIGDLVSVAARDVSQLVRYEIDLAKLELKKDVKRVGFGAALLGLALFAACLLLMLLCFAFAFGLVALGIWEWAAFLITAGACLLLIGAAALIAILLFRRIDKMSKTRRTVAGDVTMLRDRKSEVPPRLKRGKAASNGSGPARTTPDGQATSAQTGSPQPVPAGTAPAQAVPAQRASAPAQTVPVQAQPAQTAPAQTAPRAG